MGKYNAGIAAFILFSAVAAALPVQATSAAQASQSATTSEKADAKIGEIVQAFYASKDLRAFAEMAKKRPQDGGATYAFKAAFTCAEIQRFPDVKPGDYTDQALFVKKQAALKELRNRCQGFLPDELTPIRLGEQFKYKSSSGDVLEQMLGKLNEVYDELEQKKTPSAEHRRKLLNEAADLQEPLFINSAGMMNGLYYNEKKEEAVWFAGQSYTGKADLEQIVDASSWAACQFGTDCTASSLHLLMTCVYRNKCFDNADLYFRDKYASQPEVFEQLTAKRDIITAAIRTRDFSRLIRP